MWCSLSTFSYYYLTNKYRLIRYMVSCTLKVIQLHSLNYRNNIVDEEKYFKMHNFWKCDEYDILYKNMKFINIQMRNTYTRCTIS